MTTTLLPWLLGAAIVAAGPRAHAETFVVDDSNDAADATPGDGRCATHAHTCTLRAAIEESNALPGHDMITLPIGTYVLTTGVGLVVTDAVDVVASSAATTTIDGHGADTTLSVTSDGALALSGTTVSGGHATNVGGGIDNEGTLELVDCVVRDNVADNVGGGVYNDGGVLRMRGCTVTNNQAGNVGGGVHNEGQATLVNCTISGNRAENTSGGMGNEGTAVLENCTIAFNEAGNVGGGFDNDFDEAPVAMLSNTILADNEGEDCLGTLTSLGHNLVQEGACFAGTTTGDLIGVDPRLGPLTDNGGPMPTHALAPGSPAIDAGSPSTPGSGDAACAPVDERGVARAVDGDGDGQAVCDIGAFEASVPSPVVGGACSGTIHLPTARLHVKPGRQASGFDTVVLRGHGKLGSTLDDAKLAGGIRVAVAPADDGTPCLDEIVHPARFGRCWIYAARPSGPGGVVGLTVCRKAGRRFTLTVRATARAGCLGSTERVTHLAVGNDCTTLQCLGGGFDVCTPCPDCDSSGDDASLP